MSVTPRPARQSADVGTPPIWGFLTNQAVVLVYVIAHPESTVRQIAEGIGITERATLAMLRDLDEDDIVARHREGRRNTYSVDFTRLSSVRRGGVTNALTPRVFVEAVVRALFELSSQPPAGVVRTQPLRRVRAESLEARAGTWGFFTNHMLVLLAVAQDDSRTLREIAKAIGVTERAVIAIMAQLDAEHIIVRGRVGRRNSYRINFAAFKRFRGWTFGEWKVPQRLIDVAADAIRTLTLRP